MGPNTSIITIALSAILINNFIFSQFLGCCPFLGCSTKLDTAAGMGLAVIFVMGLASAICWVVNEYILIPLNLAFLQTIAYILVIAVLVQFVEMFLKKSVPSLYSALGIYLPLITTNCAVLGVVLLNTQYSFDFLQSVVYGITGGAGFMLAICLFASVREKVEFAEYPESFEGFPIALVSAGLVALEGELGLERRGERPRNGDRHRAHRQRKVVRVLRKEERRHEQLGAYAHDNQRVARRAVTVEPSPPRTEQVVFGHALRDLGGKQREREPAAKARHQHRDCDERTAPRTAEGNDT